MFVYADNAATTRVSDAVLAAMLPYFTKHYGNPSSTYPLGQEASAALIRARETMAACPVNSPLLPGAARPTTRSSAPPRPGADSMAAPT